MAEFLQSIQAGDESSDPAEPEVRLAVYDSPLAAPRVVSLRGREFHAFVGELAARTYNFGRERGGRIPYIVIREILENLFHAYFQGAVISILDDGNTIRIWGVAVVNPGCSAFSLSGMPGPWSEMRMVFPSSRMLITAPRKYAWIRFSRISRMTIYGMRPPRSRPKLYVRAASSPTNA